MKKVSDCNIREIFAKDAQWERASLHFSEKEVSYYYNELAKLSRAKGLRFTTCYIGNDASGESFERYQNLWDNKGDCCDAKGSVQNITATCADAPVKKAPKIIGAEALIPPAPNLEVKKGCSAVKGMLANLETARIAAVKAKQAELIGI